MLGVGSGGAFEVGMGWVWGMAGVFAVGRVCGGGGEFVAADSGGVGNLRGVLIGAVGRSGSTGAGVGFLNSFVCAGHRRSLESSGVERY